MAEKRVIELEIQDNSKTLKAQYKEAVLEVQRLAAAYGETSQQVAEAAKKAAGLKDQIEDTNDAIAAFKGEGKFAATGKALSAVASGFSAVEGGMALLGVESENLQKTMLKVQAAMALAQGLEGLEDAGRAFKQLGTVATNALKGVKGAIAATGIGLLVIALGTIVAYWDDIKTAVNGVSREQEKLNKLSHERFVNSKEELDNLDKQDNILRLQGKTEREILNIKIKKSIESIKAAQEDLINIQKTSDAEEKAALRNYKYATMFAKVLVDQALFIPKLMMIPINLGIKGANKISEALGLGKLVTLDLNETIDNLEKKATKFIAGSIINYDEVKAENDKVKKETTDAIKELENKKAGYELSIKELNRQSAEDNKKNVQDKLNAEKEYNEKIRAYYDALELERQSKITNAKDKELQDIDNKYEELYAKADAANQSDKELIIKHQEEVNAINEKYALLEIEMMAKAKAEANKLRIQQEQELQSKIEEIDEANFQARLQKQMEAQDYEKELVRQKYFELEEAAKGNAEQLAIIEEAKQNELTKIDETYTEKAKVAQQQKIDLVLKYAQTFGQAMSSLNGLLNANDEERLKKVKKGSKEEEDIKRKMFDRDKKLRIVQTVIDTASNVVQSVRNGGGIPTGIPFGVAAAAMGAIQIATISKAQFDGGGDQVQSPSGAGGAMAPNFNVIGSSGVNQLAQIQQQPTRAYVVSGDVANGLSLERNRLQNASF